MKAKVLALELASVRRFLAFCFVGGSGLVVDMGILFVLADPRALGWNVGLAKAIAAEIALINNFVWNHLWTFRDRRAQGEGAAKVVRRLLTFNAICGFGIGLSVALLYFLHSILALNLYLANAIAIFLVALWNYWMNAKFNWNQRAAAGPKPSLG